MTEKMKSILKEVCEAYRLNCKQIRRDRLDIEGEKIVYGTHHLICRYRTKEGGILFLWDEARNIARVELVY